MDPTLEERQANQTQEKKSGQGIIGRGIGRIGTRVVTQTALRGFSALLASQVGLPILIAIASIVVFTIVIVGFGGAPGDPSSQTSVQAPSAETTPTPTPTPAAPESAL